ncbi:trypsin-like peptidase domain-containing protein [Sphingomonas sp. 1P06PA]|uniref:trypsin-like peptidase domain-containing protein n=1 Tax=Sphingomonas sp. 1P06PA TaxID=554121 RepID=UPI0039A53F9F
MRDLTIGERVGIDAAEIRIDVDGPEMDARAGQLGAVVVALGPDRALAPGYDPITATGGEVRPGISFVENGVLRIELSKLPAAVDRIMMIVYIVGGVGSGITLRDFRSLTATANDYRMPFDLANRGEAAMILLEVYRRGSDWRLTANGQGFVGGIGALAHALGIRIDVPHPPEPDRPPHHFHEDRPGPSRRAPGASFSGSGFAVDDRHILTNAHVIDGARTIRVKSDRMTADAELVFTDPRNDVALLRIERDIGARARFRGDLRIDLGEDIVVLGFPLSGLLGTGPQASGGNVSSLSGVGNDSSVLQFTAPIASGNSGGPILDMAGHVIGLVHASLNLDHVRRAGNNAENVNFGVKGAIVRAFLATAGVDPVLADGHASRSRADIVKEARGYIFRIDCEA